MVCVSENAGVLTSNDRRAAVNWPSIAVKPLIVRNFISCAPRRSSESDRQCTRFSWTRAAWDS